MNNRMSFSMMTNFKLRSISTLFMLLFVVTGCGSPAPKTHYYTLFSDAPAVNNASTNINNDIRHIAIGPMNLPEYTSNRFIVSKLKENQLLTSSTHAWAEKLNESASRILLFGLRQKLSSNEPEKAWRVSAFPVDSRDTLDYQVKINVLELIGELGGDVRLVADISVFDINARKVVKKKTVTAQVQTSTANYSSYVSSINQLIENLAQSVYQQLVPLG